MTTPPRRTLVVVRHATAEGFAASDHERALTPYGVEQALALGQWLAAEDLRPDTAVVSSALRTRQTWEHLAAAADLTLSPQVDGAIYSGDADSVLESLHAVDPGAQTVLLLGHNPTVATLVLDLDDGRGDADLLVEVSGGYPPSSAAVLTVPGPWADLDVAGATLTRLRLGR